MLWFCETKNMGKGGEWLGNFLMVKSGFSVMARAKEGIAPLIKQELLECVKVCREVSSQLM